MNALETLDKYISTARALGTDVRLSAPSAFRGELKAFLKSEGFRIAALQEAGWPEDLFSDIKAALREAGTTVAGPGSDGKAFSGMAAAEVGITFAEHFIAETGSMALPSGPGRLTAASLLPAVHIAVGYSSGVSANLGELLTSLKEEMPSRLTLVTGPSRTGDIEASMTVCVHGPGRVLHYLLTEG